MIKDDMEYIVKKLCKSKVNLYPIGDLHIGTKDFNEQFIKEHLEKVKKDKDGYIVIVGDMLDNGVKSGKGLGVYQQELNPEEQIDKAIELLEPVKDKIIAMIPGNHEKRSIKEVGINPLYIVAQGLGLQDIYRENMAIVDIQLFLETKRKHCICNYKILLHHGKGSANNAAIKDLNFMDGFEDADCIITGHTHQGEIRKPLKVQLGKTKAKFREQIVAIVNSFSTSAAYSREAMMRPTNNKQMLIVLERVWGKKMTTIW